MRIRIKTPGRLPLENLAMFLALFCISSFALLEHVSISIPAFSVVKFPLLYAGGICLLMRLGVFINNFFKKKYFYVLLAMLFLCLMVGLSAFANRSPVIGINPMRSTLRLILFLIELFLLAIWISETGRLRYVLDFLFWYVVILVIATDVLLFSRVVVFHNGIFENYLIGTKFSVSYLHMNLLTLWFIRNQRYGYQDKRTKQFLYLAGPLCLAVTIRVDCMTGVVGCLALFVLLLMLNTQFQKRFLRFSSPSLLLLFLLGSIAFPFIVERIVSIPFVTYIVESVLGRDTTLTGRLAIYGLFGSKMQSHWLWGLGYGNGNAAAERFFQCANAQNAQLQWILQAGLPTAIMLAVLMLVIFKQLRRSARQKQIMPLVVLTYVFIILGTVETTFNMIFILWLALIFIQVNEKQPAVTDGPVQDQGSNGDG